MAPPETPEHPLTVRDLETDESEKFPSELHLITGLEFFDSQDPQEEVEVTDSKGRPVILKIGCLEIVDFKLA